MKILLTLMVKNEGKILQRCLEAGAKHADAVIVCDTGSTDNTVAIAEAYTERPCRVVHQPWQNFGHNRTLSFLAAVKYASDLEWNLEESYALVLDGDMVLRGADPHELLGGKAGYRLLQKNGGMEYYNTRFMRLSDRWRCVGVTHEYWDGPETINLDAVWIDDIGDGGAKADKFERDLRLLTKGLEDEPNNVRYMFYLAQTLKDGGRPKDAIGMYKKRIAAGGWAEEVWYSYYMISTCYSRLGDTAKAELWGQRAHAFRPGRSEPLYLLTRMFREKGDHFKAWHYLRLAERIEKPNDLLFVETSVYGPLLDYERTVLQYYVSENRDAGMDLSIRHINKNGPHADNVFNNLIFYTKPLACDWKRLSFPTEPGFFATAIAAAQNGTLNVRTVNYWITPQGKYENPGTVQTRNYRSSWNPETRVYDGFAELVIPEDTPRRPDVILGLEDVRLQGDTFTAATREFSYNEKYRMVVGSYSDMKFRPIHPPTETECEKNWLPIDESTMIYNWHPLTIGKIQEDRLEITHTIQTPAWFRHARGSIPPIPYKGDLWTLIHIVQYGGMRRYLHQWVVLDGKTYVPKSMSRPFYFKGHQTEYALGGQIWNDTMHIFTTIMDREAWNGTIPMSECVKMLVPVSSA